MCICCTSKCISCLFNSLVRSLWKTVVGILSTRHTEDFHGCYFYFVTNEWFNGQLGSLPNLAETLIGETSIVRLSQFVHSVHVNLAFHPRSQTGPLNRTVLQWKQLKFLSPISNYGDLKCRQILIFAPVFRWSYLCSTKNALTVKDIFVHV